MYEKQEMPTPICDLACECGLAGGLGLVGETEEHVHCTVSRADINNEASKLISKPAGRYVSLFFGNVWELDRDALVRIISEPKNSLVRQYEKLFEMDGVKLSFAKGALEAIAELALERNTGARGLRAIMESLMLDVMYDAPGTPGGVCRIDADVVKKRKPAVVKASKK